MAKTVHGVFEVPGKGIRVAVLTDSGELGTVSLSVAFQGLPFGVGLSLDQAAALAGLLSAAASSAGVKS